VENGVPPAVATFGHMLDRSFWRGCKVLLTGHTGFKGSWLSMWLNALGANVTGYALEPPTQPSLFEQAKLAGSIRSIYADVRDFQRLKAAVAECRADVVIHMAAQSVVRRGYEDPIETYSSNVMGTVHILEALRQLKQPCVVVADSVYGLNIPGANITRSHVGRGGGLTIGIAPMAYCDPRRYWDKDKAVYECFIRKLAEFSAGLIRDRHRLRLFSTDIWFDSQAILDLHWL